MNGIFAMDGRLIQYMNRFADLVLLNLLWFICCLPIVTIGASTTALYYVTLKMAGNEEEYVFSSFFRSFKENLKQSMIIWGMLVLSGVILYFDFYYSSHIDSDFGRMLFIPLTIATFVIVITGEYVFPVMAFFRNSTKKLVKNAFFLAIAYLPSTVLLIIVSFLPLLLLLTGNFMIVAFIDVVIGVSLSAWINAHIFRRIFKRYMI